MYEDTMDSWRGTWKYLIKISAISGPILGFQNNIWTYGVIMIWAVSNTTDKFTTHNWVILQDRSTYLLSYIF